MENVSCQRQMMLMTENAKLNYLVLQWFYTVLCIPTFVANLLVIVALCKLKCFKLRHHIFLLMLSITDILSSVTAQPLIAFDFFLLTSEINKCEISNMTRIFGYTLAMMSITTIAFINFDLFIAIAKPYTVPIRMCHVLLIMFSLWLVMFVSTLFCIHIFPQYIQQFKVAVSVYVVFTFCTLCCTQAKIQFELKKLLKRSKGPAEIKAKDLAAQVRVSRMAKSVLSAFGFCYLPFILCSGYQIFDKDSIEFTSTYVRTWTYVITFMNPILDPIIYCFRLKKIKRVLYFCNRRTSTTESSSTDKDIELRRTTTLAVICDSKM